MKKSRDEKGDMFYCRKYWQNVTMPTRSFGNSVPGNDMIKQ